MDGQGGNAPESMDDLAEFLVDNPEADESEETEVASTDEPEEGSDESTADDADEASEEDPEQQAPRKHKVTVKGEDGADQEIEVEEKELIAGYQRHADYTRKTQELGNREREVTQALATKHQEMQGHYLQQAQMAQAAVFQLAGLKSAQEMAALAQTDPTAWVQEQQRAQAVHSLLSQIEHGIRQEKAKQDEQTQQAQAKAYQEAWTALSAEGFDKPKLQALYDKASKAYGLTNDDLATVMDPKAVRVLRDAVAYQELKAKKAEVKKQAEKAAPLPAQRQTVPKSEQRMKTLNTRFKSGRAKLSDLAAFIESN